MLPDKFLELLVCPHCKHDGLTFNGNNIWAACGSCGASFERIKGIPFLSISEFTEIARGNYTIDTQEALNDNLDANTVKYANAEYHNKFSADYEDDVSTYEIYQDNGPCQKRIISTLQEAALVSGNNFLLDVCCGTGNILRSAQKSFKQSLGIDISVNMMAIARNRNLNTIGADALDIPIKSETMNCVTAFSALHHIVDYPGAVREMVRILKRGGTFYSDWDPNGHVTHTGWAVSMAVELVKKMRRFTNDDVIPETREQQAAEFHHHSTEGFDAERVGKILKDAGFRKVKVIYHTNPENFVKANSWNLNKLAMAILKLVSFKPPNQRNINPWVAVLAVK